MRPKEPTKPTKIKVHKRIIKLVERTLRLFCLDPLYLLPCFKDEEATLGG